MPESTPPSTPTRFRIFFGAWAVTALLFLGATAYYAVKASKSSTAVTPLFVDVFVVVILLFLSTTLAFLVAAP